MRHRLAVLIACGLLAACSTTVSITRGMAAPVESLRRSAAIARDADHDMLEAYFIGQIDEPATLVGIVCVPWSGPERASADLELFSRSLDAVRLAGDPGGDPGYGGLERKLAKNKAAPSSLSIATAREQAAAAMERQQQRCQRLFAADASADPSLKSLDTGPAALITALSPLLAIDNLIKKIANDIEVMQREAAARATVQALIPSLKEASRSLRAAPTAAFGPMVRYAPAWAGSDAVAMNGSNVGATINVRRWFLARQILALSTYLAPCRRRERSDCLADPALRSAARELSHAVRVYRAVAKVDAVAITRALDNAILAAQDSLDTLKSPADVLDALITLSSATTDLSAAYDRYERSLR